MGQAICIGPGPRDLKKKRWSRIFGPKSKPSNTFKTKDLW